MMSFELSFVLIHERLKHEMGKLLNSSKSLEREVKRGNLLENNGHHRWK